MSMSPGFFLSHLALVAVSVLATTGLASAGTVCSSAEASLRATYAASDEGAQADSTGRLTFNQEVLESALLVVLKGPKTIIVPRRLDESGDFQVEYFVREVRVYRKDHGIFSNGSPEIRSLLFCQEFERVRMP